MNTPKFIVEEFSPPLPGEEVVMGTYSEFWRNKPQRREVLKRHAVSVDGDIDSPTHHARNYLKNHYPGKHIAKRCQYDLLCERIMPIYAVPSSSSDACYVDIKSAWWKILNITGWDCDYYPGKWFSRGEPPTDFPLPSHKVARSALVSLAISTRLPVYKDGKTTWINTYNELENRHIYAVIADVLHSIAQIAIHSYSCNYVATDGFIMPTSCVEDFVVYLNTWGLDAGIKGHGPTWIMGVGSYVVGSMQSRRPASGNCYSNIRDDIDPTWLQRRITG